MEYNKKNVGIVGYWFATNYGGVASYFSLYRKIKELGYNPFFIDNPYYKTDKEGEDVFSKIFFRENGFRIAEPHDMSEIDDYNKLSDIFILGSDQVLTTSSIKAFGKLFLMEFVEEGKKKIAFSASCGGDDLNNKEIIDYAQKQLKKFNNISIREFKGVETLKRLGFDTRQVIDPILFTTKEAFEEIGKWINNDENNNYFLSYVLDPTPDKKKCINTISAELGMPVKIALDGRKYTHNKNFNAMGMPEETLPELDFVQWINYMSNASYIFTDSFHGAVLSLILNKPFIMYGNALRGMPRFETLVELFNIGSRMILSSGELYAEKITEAIDYDRINGRLEKYKKDAEKLLSSVLEETRKNAVTNKLNMNMCTGCSACVNICPKNALELKPDSYGYFRSTLNSSKCIDCGLCSKICPALNLPHNTNTTEPECYEFICSNPAVLVNSSSGGAFTVLAEEIFRRNGYVCAVAWKEDFTVEHIIINNRDDLYKLQKSKYLQSYLGNVFSKIKQILEEGSYLLFAGCPCQVAGLKAFLNRDYDNLLLIDLFCGNSPSQMFFNKYLKESFPEGIKQYDFRAKEEVWNCESVTIIDNNNNRHYRKGGASDQYQRVYHTHTMCSVHCEKCKYQKLPRFGDITIGDFWGIKKHDPGISSEKGVSAVLLNNDRGKHFFDSIDEKECSVRKKVPLEWIGHNGFAIMEAHNYCSPNRDDFYKKIIGYSFTEAANYALKPDHGHLVNSPDNHTLSPLQYNSRMIHFDCDNNVWSEGILFGVPTLFVKEGLSKQERVGKFAVIPFYNILRSSNEYVLTMRIKINTAEPNFYMYIKDSGSKSYQMVKCINGTDKKKDWIVIREVIRAKSDIYDQFMMPATNFSGICPYICIDYINIEMLK